MLKMKTAPVGVLPDKVISDALGFTRAATHEYRKRHNVEVCGDGIDMCRLREWVRGADYDAILAWAVPLAERFTPDLLIKAIKQERYGYCTLLSELEDKGVYVD